MRNKMIAILIAGLMVINSRAQNPIITNQFSADPSARVFGNSVYVYPSHDILAEQGKGRIGWFCMEDYHAFSSTNLTDWTDHGVIVTQNNIPWVKQNSYSMWAPDCIERNGKYFFYFPTSPADTIKYGRGFRIGVAVADKPAGPFVPQPEPINDVRGIDPNVFIDKDGQAYLYWSAGNIFAAKLKADMLELDSEVKTLGDLPAKGLKEGPYMFERNGIYYLTYPHVENKIERLEYAISNNPLGPFKVTGVIMDESETGCWTNHHSIIRFKQQWYLFYHHNDYSPAFDKARSVCIDSLSFNTDGTIKKVIPTKRGVGLTKATDHIQIDRYTQLSEKGASVAFLDTADKFKGWKIIYSAAGAWSQYNSIDFGKQQLKYVSVKVQSAEVAVLQLRVNNVSGPVLAEIKIPAGKEWKTVKTSLRIFQAGIKNLYVTLKNGQQVEADWISFQ